MTPKRCQIYKMDQNSLWTITQPKLQYPQILALSKPPVVCFWNLAHHDADPDHAHLKVSQILLNGLNFD